MEPMNGSSDTEDDWELNDDVEGVRLSPNEWAPCVALHHVTNYSASSAKPPQVLPARSFISRQVASRQKYQNL